MGMVIKVPTGDELRDRLSGINRLLVVRGWERAAIVYAFTVVGEIGAGRWHKPEPPKMHIREFAAQGYAGLTTNKSVSRYRDAWVTAISNGWASPVEPGQEVTLPDEPFPAWPYGSDSDDDAEHNITITELGDNVHLMRDHRGGSRGPNRSVTERVLAHLESTAKALGQLSDITPHELDDQTREALVMHLTELERQTGEALRALRRLTSV